MKVSPFHWLQREQTFVSLGKDLLDLFMYAMQNINMHHCQDLNVVYFSRNDTFQNPLFWVPSQSNWLTLVFLIQY